MSAEAIHVEINLCKFFGEFQLNVELELSLEGITAIFGSSGSGKTSLLRIIAGLENPDTGRLAVGGDVWFQSGVVNKSPTQRRAGLVFQDANLFTHMNVEQNIQYAYKRAPKSKHSFLSFSQIIEALDLRPLLGRRETALSGGERQRVALARAIANHPRLLMLDEPLSALDAMRKSQILPYLKQIPDQFGMPLIYVSHSLDEVTRLADQIIILDGGKVQSHGPAHKIFDQFDLHTQMQGMESGVVLKGSVCAHDKSCQLFDVELDGTVLEIPSIFQPKIGQIIGVKILAHDVAISLKKPEQISIRNVLKCTVLSIEEMAGTAFVEVKLRTSNYSLRSYITRKSARELALINGMEVFALIKSASFDRL